MNPKYPTGDIKPKQAKAAFRRYVAEMGFLAQAWNELHHNLSAIFGLLLRSRGGAKYAQAIWHASDSDHIQRKMLRAIVEADASAQPRERLISDELAESILWLINRTDELRHKRNDAIHAPLMIDRQTGRVEAHFNPQNPRAKPLQGKDLMQEFRDYAAWAKLLSKYANDLFLAIHLPAQHSLPKKPRPPQAHKTKQKPRQV